MRPFRPMIGLFAYALTAGALAAAMPAIAAAEDTQPITITASNYQFSPGTITAHVGEPVTLKVTSTGGVHGIASSELGIAQTLLVPGQSKTVSFHALEGRHVCHSLHGAMWTGAQ